MVNIHQLVSGITARWSKSCLLFLIILFSFSGRLFAQQKEDPLNKRERKKYNEIFFEAEKEKNLGNTEKALDLYEELYSMSSSNATVCYELAQIYATKGESNKAVDFARCATDLDHHNKWYQLLLAGIYGEFSMWEEQIKVLNHLISLDTTNPDYRYELSMAYLQNEEPLKAVEQLNEVEEDIGINEMVSNQKKLIYLEMGDLESAAAEIERLIEAHPKNMDYYGSLAQLYMANDRKEEAYRIYKDMLKIDPDDPRIHLDLAQYYRNISKFEKSLHHLKQAVGSPNLGIDQKVPVLLSLFEATAQDSLLRNEAYQMLHKVVELHPGDPKAHAILGDFLSRDGKNIEALKAYKNAVKLEGGNRFQIWEQILLIEIQGEMYDSLLKDAPAAIELFPNRPIPYFFAGVAHNAEGEPMEAVGYLEDGVAYVMGNPRLKEQFYTQLAGAYHELGEHEKSDSYFEKALALNSENPTVLNNYAYYLSERGEKLDKALQMTQKSNRLAPGNPTFLDTWAWVLYKKGNYAEALSKMEEVVKSGVGNNAEVLEHYGDILYKNGRTAEAVEQWKKARATGDASDEIEEKINSGQLVE